MEAIVSVALLIIVVFIGAGYYIEDKNIAQRVEKGNAVMCNGSVIKGAQLIRIGEKLYVKKGKLMFPIEKCEKPSTE